MHISAQFGKQLACLKHKHMAEPTINRQISNSEDMASICSLRTKLKELFILHTNASNGQVQDNEQTVTSKDKRSVLSTAASLPQFGFFHAKPHL